MFFQRMNIPCSFVSPVHIERRDFIDAISELCRMKIVPGSFGILRLYTVICYAPTLYISSQEIRRFTVLKVEILHYKKNMRI